MSDVPVYMRQGDTWALRVNWFNPAPGTNQPDASSPVDITGYSARLQVSSDQSADASVLLVLTSSPVAGLVVQPGGVLGRVDVYAAPAQTLAVPEGRWYWAVEVENGTDKYTLGSGPLTVGRRVV